MTDTFERLQAALADRYVVERKLGSGGMAAPGDAVVVWVTALGERPAPKVHTPPSRCRESP